MPVGVHSIVTSGTTSKTTAARTSAAAGSTFVMPVAWARTVNLNSISDSKGNTYTQRGTTLENFAFDLRLAFYVCEDGVGGAGHTGTAVFAADGFASVGLIEVPGVLAASFDQIVTANDAASPFEVTTGTLAQANSLVLAFLASNGSGATVNGTESSGFTLVEETTDGANYYCLHAFEKTVSATAALTPSMTATGGTNAGVAALVFKLAGGGGPSVMPKRLLHQRFMRG